MAEKKRSLELIEPVKDMLQTVEREREREIIARRFGLYDRKETLEQIGELLGITRERVRQLEKAILARLKAHAADGKLPHIKELQKEITRHLVELGRVATVADLTKILTSSDDHKLQAHVTLIATVAPDLVLLDENDHYRRSVALGQYYTETSLKQAVDNIVKAIKAIGQPVTIEELHARLQFEHPQMIQALASVSKDLATLHGRWGLIKWPLVNPKNIRDKIYIVLKENGKPMHFSEIAKSIRSSNFKRKDVTTQAIHNELIKDKRFVLIGRGIYALKEWGFKKGTVADVISEILRKAGEPLHRDEIVRRVLKKRQVKETTILLNLQGKPQFKRVAKATYALAENDIKN